MKRFILKFLITLVLTGIIAWPIIGLVAVFSEAGQGRGSQNAILLMVIWVLVSYLITRSKVKKEKDKQLY
ncbi:MAG: hypothetical protein AAB594_01075 [Patescibacteria group bacterium]